MDIITKYSEQNSIDPLFILSIIRAESNFNTHATSHKDAKGLMQIRTETALWCAQKLNEKSFSEEKLFEPETNIKLGAWYFKYLLGQFKGDYYLSLAAYNAGIGNVQGWLENPKYSSDGISLEKVPFGETERYIKKVINNYAIYKMLKH